ncbi:MAG: glycosyltransferase family 2 protein [Candidatus Bathyarchaeota archaeon]
MLPRVSVVIPTWNEYPQIVRLLNSLKVQTLLPWEIIVVDKDSTDGTGKYSERAGSRVIYDLGSVAAARNVGVKACSGDIVAFTEGDIVLPHGWVETITSKFSEDQKLLAVAGPGYPYDSTGLSPNVVVEYLLYNRFRAFMSRLRYFMCSGYNMAVRREVFDSIQFPDIVPNDDGLFGHMVSGLGRTLFSMDLPVQISSRRFRKLGFAQANLYYLFMIENISPVFKPLTNMLRARSAEYFKKVKK